MVFVEGWLWLRAPLDVRDKVHTAAEAAAPAAAPAAALAADPWLHNFHYEPNF